MKIIGTFPAAKGWVVHYNAKTGAIYGDYKEPIGLTGKQIDERAKAAFDILKANPVRPPNPPEHPGWGVNRDDPEALAAWEKKVRAHQDARDNQWRWDRADEEVNWRWFEYAPVFRDVATFFGYTRGRSSVTMQFKFADGSLLEIGPSGIDKFILGVQNGSIVRKDGGFDLTFRMEKKGANVYMMPMFNEHEFKGMTVIEAPGA